MSQIAINDGDAQKAIRLLNERKNRIAATAVTEHLIGGAYLEAGDYTAAKDVFAAFVDNYPNATERFSARFQLAEAYQALEQQQAAEKHYEHLKQTGNPEWAPLASEQLALIWVDAAEQHENNGEEAAAKALYEKLSGLTDPVWQGYAREQLDRLGGN